MGPEGFKRGGERLSAEVTLHHLVIEGHVTASPREATQGAERKEVVRVEAQCVTVAAHSLVDQLEAVLGVVSHTIPKR